MKTIVGNSSTDGGTISSRARAIIIRKLRWVRRGCARREGTEIVMLIMGEKISRGVGTGGAPALRR
jgi:hypothetical protein